jgi:hypothetical protein
MRAFLLALLCALLATGCSGGGPSQGGGPSEGDGRAAFEAHLRNAVGNAGFAIDSFEKTNGQRFEESGAPAYRLFYTARVTFPRGYRPECAGNSGGFRGFDCSMAASRGGPRPREAGAVAVYSGQVVFQETERGWVPSNVTLSESPAPPAAARPAGVPNPGSDRLKTLSPINQRIGLMRAIRASGQTCGRVITVGYQQQYRDLAMWVALCAGGRNWAVFIAPNEQVQVRNCTEHGQLGLPACRPVAPLPPDPGAPAGTEVDPGEVEAANANLVNSR